MTSYGLKKFMRQIMVAIALIIILVVARSADATPKAHSHQWKATYNSALSLHEAAVPLKVYPVGTKIRLTYHHHSVWVRSISGGCTCFDISDEAFNVLSDTSQGVITVTAIKL